MRAISALSLDAGTSTFGWRATMALRTRVSMSAIGSLVMLYDSFLPTGLDDAGDLAIQGELPEAETANAEFAEEAARPSAAPAAIAVPAAELRRLLHLRLEEFYVLGDLGGSGHTFSF